MSTTATAVNLGAVSVVGPLWGGDLLAAVRDSNLHKDVAHTVKAASYDQPKNADVEALTRAAWTTLKAAWIEFAEQLQDRIARAAGETAYGRDDFTWDTWTRHLLGSLGYHPEAVTGGLAVDNADPDDPADTYDITHLHAGQVPVHAIPAGGPLGTRTPGIPGGMRQSPHSTVQDYLNRTDRHLWAVLTNGLTLRLLRDNAAMSRQAYIEYDLAAIFDEGDYATFALMWRTAHATRFTHPDGTLPTDCIAETWQDHATKVGVAALDDLREGVEEAISLIGSALVRHPANDTLRAALADPDDPYDAAALYRELLYVIYRHVFWFVLDDRNLLHPVDADATVVDLYRDGYASTVLRDKARRHRGGQHVDGWTHYLLIASWFAHPNGQPALGIPGLLGHLWSPDATAHLNDAVIDNRAYYAAIRSLAYVEREHTLRRINYDILGSEELGAVYESLLEIVPDVDVPSRTFTIERSAGNDRKRTGSYYTPTSLINVLLDEVLDEVVSDAMAAAVAAVPDDASPTQQRQAKVAAILGDPETGATPLTVCDPAMGSAHFLVAAGWRLARHVATARTGETDPDILEVQRALRDVAARCLYGVDINPMAVELAKVAIWLEAHVPGQPLTFLDHHLKCGNGLLGIGFDPGLMDYHVHSTACSCTHDSNGKKFTSGMTGGLTADAFSPHGKDSAKVARSMRTFAEQHATGSQSNLFAAAGAPFDFAGAAQHIAAASLSIGWLDDSSPEALEAKQQAHMTYGHTDELERLRLRADAFVATWTMRKTEELFESGTVDLPYHVFYDTHYNGMPGDDRNGVRIARAEAEQHRFFHWAVEFPDIAAAGGFSCLLGNPPWGSVATNAQTWFTARGHTDIAKAPNQSARNKLIDKLRASELESDQTVAADWDDELRQADVLSHFIKSSGRIRHPGSGTSELSAIFAGFFTDAVVEHGRSGLLCRESVATGKSNIDWLGDVLGERRLQSFYMFENEDRLFAEVDHTRKFAICVLRGRANPTDRVGITGFIRQPDDIVNPDRRYDLTVDEIRAINPQTVNIPIFRNSHDAIVTARLHSAVDVMCPNGEDDPGPWGFTFHSMFHMSGDSGLFVTAAKAAEQGFTKDGTWFVHSDGTTLVPLHEGKMVWNHDYRYGTYENRTQADANRKVLPRLPEAAKNDPAGYPLHNYWVDRKLAEKAIPDHWKAQWLIGFRDKGTKERTMLAAVLPRIAAGHSLPLTLPERGTARQHAFLVGDLNSLPWDYAVRQKGLRMFKYVVQQTPTLPPPSETESTPWPGTTLLDFVVPRVVELTYLTHELRSFAADCGHDGEPFRHDDDRRAVITAELDALFFMLHGADRTDVEHIMDSFDLLATLESKPPEKGGHSEFRTKRLVLERYDAMTKATETGHPYVCPLDVPPAANAMRHP